MSGLALRPMVNLLSHVSIDPLMMSSLARRLTRLDNVATRGAQRIRISKGSGDSEVTAVQNQSTMLPHPALRSTRDLGAGLAVSPHVCTANKGVMINSSHFVMA